MKKQVTSYFKTGWDLKFYPDSTYFFFSLQSIFRCVVLGLFFILLLGFLELEAMCGKTMHERKKYPTSGFQNRLYQDFFPFAWSALDCNIIVFWQCLVYSHGFFLNFTLRPSLFLNISLSSLPIITLCVFFLYSYG